MFVRWKRRESVSRRQARGQTSAPPRKTGRFTISAVLVRCERVDGKPRQKVVAYLGSIALDRKAEVHERRYFWKGVSSRLNSLALDVATRQRVELALHATVPFPTAAEVAQADREFRQMEESLKGL